MAALSRRGAPVQVPVLTYHSVNIIRNTYAENDHIALAEDLRTIDRLGRRVVPLELAVEVARGGG
ncbi:MAG: hypothetical protein HKN58_10265, partial [Xanthomonadales bacterium]|nr:hypothetical protein [Xanthomonadales bacterium]